MGTSASPAGREEVSGSDQRQSTRKVISEPIAVELQPGREAWIRDVGEGGLSISGDSPLELGSRATIRFELPEGDSVIDGSGVVTWADQSGRAGVRFTQLEAASTAALRRWLSAGAHTVVTHSGAAHENDLAAKVECLRQVADLQGIILSERLETLAALDLIVRRIAELTRATGAAIALRDGENVICRASFGNAPDVGVKLSSTSLSGECLRSGTVVMLEDSENDPRVNPEVCRQLNFRSLLILPVIAGKEVIGIAEALSPDLRNFDDGDVLVLSFLTDLIATFAAPRTEVDEPDYRELIMLSEPQENTGVQSPVQATSPAAPLLASSLVAAPQVARVPMRATILSKEKSRRILKATPILIPTRGLALYVITAVLATALTLLGYSYYRQIRTSNKPINSPSSVSSNASSPAPLPASVSSNTSAATPVNPGMEAKPFRTARSAATTVTRTESETPELSVIQGHTVNVRPAEEPTAPEPLASLPAPSGTTFLPASIVNANPATPRLGATQFVPAQSQGVIPGKLIKRVLPQYPDMARRAGVSGEVVISGIIGTDGTLHNLKAVSGSPLLRDAALEAARQWRYSPYLLGGKAVEAETHITISFRQ